MLTTASKNQTDSKTCPISTVTIASVKNLFFAIVLVASVLPVTRHFFSHWKAVFLFYPLIISFLVTYLLIPVMIRVGHRYHIVDVPDAQRKFHKTATPLTGGIALFCGFIGALLFNFRFSVEMKAILITSAIVFIMGIVDDRYGLSARIRLCIQVITSLIVIFFGVRVSFVPEWFDGYYVEVLFTLVWILGITNSMNFIDGMDGIASGSCIIYSFFFALIAYFTNQSYMLFIALALLGSCLGFFPYNYRHKKSAHIFLGDSGSTFLGFLIANLAIIGEWGYSIIDLAIPVLVLSVLIFDTTLTTFLRIYRKQVRTFKQWIDFTGRDHFHYQLHAIGLPKRLLIAIYFMANVAFGLAAVEVLFSNILISVVVLLHCIVLFIIIGIILVHGNTKHVQVKQSRQKSES
ncbi:MAG: undecaprenyl/decaprenyl-phosphate alpha-N-acetylglucosaminyl 1-phosphate transferase [Chitinivibrionales bacterium]|nr:undecaprenyl/decaprenyl-phosphate alpha-N-acetylglucosaminyl 1-phosphate transferase [Chitinivibrionales bacterium]